MQRCLASSLGAAWCGLRSKGGDSSQFRQQACGARRVARSTDARRHLDGLGCGEGPIAFVNGES